MSSKLEEIARAICEASGKSWRTGTFTALTGTDFINNKMTWEEHDLDAYNNHWRHIALAAVRAMREPSKQMIVAGDDEKEVCVDSYYSSGEYVTDVNSDIAARIWREMIDSILSEAKQEEG